MPAKQIIYKGKTYTSIKTFAEAYGINKQNVVRRLNSGWSVAQAIGEEEPPKRKAHNAQKICVAGKKFGSVRQAAKFFNLPEKRVKRRIQLGWTMEQSFGIAEPPKLIGNHSVQIEFLGKTFPSSRARDDYYNLPYNMINKRIKRGWTEKQAAGIDPPPHRHRNIDGSPRKTNLSVFEEIDGRVFHKANVGEYKLYAVTNSANKKQYIGVTTSAIQTRFLQHIYNAFNSTRPAKLYRAMRKYGKDAFSIELIRNDAENYKQLMKQEYDEIENRNSITDGYNSSVGGELGTGQEIEVDGKIFMTHAAAAEYYGIEQTKFNWRIRNGWTKEQAAEIDDWDGAGPKQIVVEGIIFRSIQAAAKHYKLSANSASQRIRSGWTPEEAMGLVKKEGLKNEEVSIELKDRSFPNQASFCRSGGFSDATVLLRRKEGWDYQKIWDQYANGGRERACVVCGELFRAMRRNKKYCSDKCKFSKK